MSFNSLEFLVFFAAVFALYCALNMRWQNRMLLAASYVFYGWIEPRFVVLMAITTIFDYLQCASPKCNSYIPTPLSTLTGGLGLPAIVTMCFNNVNTINDNQRVAVVSCLQSSL